ncbi:transposase [Brucella pseudogrignonensis]|uniref:transposase n=1 Tax=Brucella pseudogrignonensis TaxID=419475 RepID=UPI001E477560|nr:transposase [Brucella pseudogrignonensis]MCD4511783.1 transposase [Brucella pseudogrignonensis]
MIRYTAASRPGKITSTTASVKAALRALARRWLSLHDEIQNHDEELEHLVAACAPGLLASHGIATMTVAEMLILIGDDPTRILSEAELAKLYGVCPIPASRGKINCFRLNRGGNRQANAPLYRVAIVRIRNHEPTLAYVKKRMKDGKRKSEFIPCIKRYIIGEIFQHLCMPKNIEIAA